MSLQGMLTATFDPDIVDEVDYQQFTGLHDKNGKEIYEGDVVIDRWTTSERKGEIGFAPREGFGLIEYWDGAKHDTVTRLWARDGEIEVIGNVHENSDLLV